MELFWLLFLLLLPLIIASVIWWFRAARGIVRAADALERIADHLEARRVSPPPVIPAEDFTDNWR
jgi:hypothetical protein